MWSPRAKRNHQGLRIPQKEMLKSHHDLCEFLLLLSRRLHQLSLVLLPLDELPMDFPSSAPSLPREWLHGPLQHILNNCETQHLVIHSAPRGIPEMSTALVFSFYLLPSPRFIH